MADTKATGDGFDPNRKVALVTGGGNEAGFGAAIAKRFVLEGAKVLIGDLDEQGAIGVAEKLNSSNVKAVKMDERQ